MKVKELVEKLMKCNQETSIKLQISGFIDIDNMITVKDDPVEVYSNEILKEVIIQSKANKVANK